MPRRIVVLLAEDEELIRVVAAEALRIDEGFEVIEAIHAKMRCNSLETHATVIHVAVHRRSNAGNDGWYRLGTSHGAKLAMDRFTDHIRACQTRSWRAPDPEPLSTEAIPPHARHDTAIFARWWRRSSSLRRRSPA